MVKASRYFEATTAALADLCQAHTNAYGIEIAAPTHTADTFIITGRPHEIIDLYDRLGVAFRKAPVRGVTLDHTISSPNGEKIDHIIIRGADTHDITPVLQSVTDGIIQQGLGQLSGRMAKLVRLGKDHMDKEAMRTQINGSDWAAIEGLTPPSRKADRTSRR